jgi:FKBP-type peptidyl-prolyl cis-trans isomerase SlyD
MITKGKVVALRYTMSSAGKLLDEVHEPEEYVHGTGSIVPGLERTLTGKLSGDRFTVTLSAADGFGPKRQGAGPQGVPRATFPPEAELKVGMKFSAETPDGKPVTLYICKVDDDAVMVDTTHPYAGMRLRYEVEVMSVRDATPEEKQAFGLD